MGIYALFHHGSLYLLLLAFSYTETKAISVGKRVNDNHDRTVHLLFGC